ncbi:hypothetical protein I552_9790 [Mycobacterium xenopi 3993]|nr:hypothetical protein I552_9790 [Mycobacterium xenopi 3993]
MRPEPHWSADNGGQRAADSRERHVVKHRAPVAGQPHVVGQKFPGAGWLT